MSEQAFLALKLSRKEVAALALVVANGIISTHERYEKGEPDQEQAPVYLTAVTMALDISGTLDKALAAVAAGAPSAVIQ